ALLCNVFLRSVPFCFRFAILSKAIEKQNCACSFYLSEVKKFQLLPFFPLRIFVRAPFLSEMLFVFKTLNSKKKSDVIPPIFRRDLGLV
ncbi:hypothetical protein K8089_16425, partial [Aequorivita sp. F47161]